jgi:hypothetical protein
MFRSNRPFVPVNTDRKIYTTEIGIVNEVFPHSEAKDKANYQCNLTLRDSSVFLKEVPVATQHIGLTSIPKVGDLVLVSFLNGDLNRPVVTGTLYHSKGIAPLNAEGEITYVHREVKEDKQEVPPKKDDKKPRRFHMMLPSGMTMTVKDEEVYYRYDNYQFDLMRMYTNLPACGAQRGHGAPQPKYAFESHLDNVARDLGIDPIEFRKLNARKANTNTCNGMGIQSCHLSEALEKIDDVGTERDDQQGRCTGEGDDPVRLRLVTSINFFEHKVVYFFFAFFIIRNFNCINISFELYTVFI